MCGTTSNVVNRFPPISNSLQFSRGGAVYSRAKSLFPFVLILIGTRIFLVSCRPTVAQQVVVER